MRYTVVHFMQRKMRKAKYQCVSLRQSSYRTKCMLYDQRFYDGMRETTHRLSINFTQRTTLSASTNVFCDIIRRNLFWTVQLHVKFLRKSLLNFVVLCS